MSQSQTQKQKQLKSRAKEKQRNMLKENKDKVGNFKKGPVYLTEYGYSYKLPKELRHKALLAVAVARPEKDIVSSMKAVFKSMNYKAVLNKRNENVYKVMRTDLDWLKEKIQKASYKKF